MCHIIKKQNQSCVDQCTSRHDEGYSSSYSWFLSATRSTEKFFGDYYTRAITAASGAQASAWGQMPCPGDIFDVLKSYLQWCSECMKVLNKVSSNLRDIWRDLTRTAGLPQCTDFLAYLHWDTFYGSRSGCDRQRAKTRNTSRGMV